MKSKWIYILGILAVIVVLAVVIIYAGFLLYLPWPVYFGNVYFANIDKAGAFGDSFGVLTALFSGIAIALIFITMLIQKQELAFVKEQLGKQNFENTFFKLLSVYIDIANSLEYGHPNSLEKGRECFRQLFSDFKTYYKNQKLTGGVKDEERKIQISYAKVNETFPNTNLEVTFCFGNLHEIIKFVINSEVKNIAFYINLVRVQLTSRELLLLFYHLLYEDEKQKDSRKECDRIEFKQLIEKHGLFESLPIHRLLNKEHKELYRDRAYRRDV